VNPGNCTYKIYRAPKVLSFDPVNDVDEWQAGTQYYENDWIKPTPVNATGLVYQCTARTGTGTSDAAEPGGGWGTTIGGTTIDNPGANQLTWTARKYTLRKWIATSGKGAVPGNCDKICTYNGRICLSGDPTAVFYQSRQGDPNDWDYTYTDAGRPIYSSNEDSWQVARPITAMIPHGSDYLLMATDSELWRQEGDLAFGGRIVNLSKTTGIVDKTAWTFTRYGEIVFLANDGLYSLPPGGAPTSWTKVPLPRELMYIDPIYFNVLLAYEPGKDGIYLYKAAPETRPTSQYFFDRKQGGIWRMTLGPTAKDKFPTVLHYYNPQDTAEACVIHGCYDGFLRRFRDTFESDEGEVLSDYVLIGPIQVAAAGEMEGVLERLIAVATPESGPISYTIRAAPTAEGCMDADLFAGSPPLADGYFIQTGSWTAGYNRPTHVRHRGAYFVIILYSGSSKRAWALESLTAHLALGGRRHRA